MVGCAYCESYARKITQLEEELKESKEDREFVKSLWRQVQTDSTDIGSVVNVVLEKVARQTEEKDRNLLQILHDKDGEIANLKKEIEWLENSVQSERHYKEELQADWNAKQDDLNELINQLEEQLAVKNLQLTDPIRQQKQEDIADRLDQNKSDLEKQLIDMRKDLKTCIKQMNVLKKKHEDQGEENARLRSMLSTRTTEVETHKLIMSDFKENISDKKEDNMLLKERLAISENDANSALRALEKCEAKVRSTEKDLLELEIQEKQRGEEHALAFHKLNTTISSLEEKIRELVQQEDMLREENSRLKREDCVDCTRHVKKIEHQEKTIKDKDKYVKLVASVKDKCVSYLNRPLALQDIPDVVDIILADVTGNTQDLQRSTKLIKQLQHGCKEKDVAFAKLKEVHDKRQERLATLQDYLSEVLDEVKELDKDRWKELYCDFRDIHPPPQPLRHEDSSTVWNDLQYYKHLSSKLQRELHAVEEEFDKIKLQRVIDTNTLIEMRAAILRDQQVCEEKLRLANHQSVCGCNLQLEMMRDKVEESSARTEALNSENIQLLSALQAEQGKVAKLQTCLCDMADGSTQTAHQTKCSVATVTDNISVIRQKESSTFTNTLTLLDKLASDKVKNPPAAPVILHSKTPVKSSKRVMGKCVGTQTLSRPPVKVLQKPPTAMKIRMASLNQQIAVLTKAKHKHSKEVCEEREKSQRLENQLSSTLRQITSSQNLISSLNEDVRVGNEESQSLRDQLHELENNALRQSELATLHERAAEIKKLNHHNNLLSSKINNMTSTINDLNKQEEEQKICMLNLEDKISRSEKVVRQQRTDSEQLRKELSQLKAVRTEQSDTNTGLQQRVRKVQDVADNRKNYIDTLKSQLSNAKANVEQGNFRYTECKAALDLKSKELKVLQRKQADTDGMIADIQNFASKQIQDQGDKLGEVERGLNRKCNVLNKRNLQWEKCIRQVIGEIVNRIKQEKDRRVVTSSLSSTEYDRAKHLSSSLLNLSEADFHDIMSSTKLTNDRSGNLSEIWKGQLAKIMSLEEFGPILKNSIIQLFEEYGKLLTGEVSSSVITDNSSTHVGDEESEDPVKLPVSFDM